MPSTDFIDQLRRRLLELDCPVTHLRRLVQEVADHREDLKQASLSEGLSEAHATARAEAQLGDPLLLAEHLMVMRMRSSWWGRHCFVTFGLVPLLAFPVLWLLLLSLNFILAFALGYGWDGKKLHAAAGDPVKLHYLAVEFHCADCVAVILVVLLFCWLARRLAVRFGWMAISCGICSLYAVFGWVKIVPHSLTVGFSLPPAPWFSFNPDIS